MENSKSGRVRFFPSPQSPAPSPGCAARSPASRTHGFTLIEILAAFVVFVLAFGAVMHALTGSLHNTVRSGNYTEAALLARSKMATLGLTQALEPGSDSGEFENGYRWRLEIHEYEAPQTQASERPGLGQAYRPPTTADAAGLGLTPPVQLLEAVLTVSWGEEPDARRTVFKTVRAVRPEL